MQFASLQSIQTRDACIIYNILDTSGFMRKLPNCIHLIFSLNTVEVCSEVGNNIVFEMLPIA